MNSSANSLRALRLSLVALAGFSVAIFILLLRVPSPDASAQLLKQLIASPGITRFDSLTVDHDWDRVCYLDPYTLPSERLSSQLREEVRDFRFDPEDSYFQEDEIGIALIDHRGKSIHIYRFDIMTRGLFQPAKFTRPAINTIEGPRCLTRARAGFLVEDIAAPNLTYTRLLFVERE